MALRMAFSASSPGVTLSMQSVSTRSERASSLCYEEVSLECLLSGITPTKRVADIIAALQEKDTDGVLRETIAAYVEDNDNYALICEKIHVHRNTLNYRLRRIEELFDCNPRRVKDLMLLYIAVIQMEKDGEN